MSLNPDKTRYEITAIMATYNEKPHFLHRCVDSILNQTFRNFELIIVVEPDEMNMDYLKKVSTENSNVKILKNKSRLGVSGSRNRGILAGSGKYIAIIDGDDYCDATRFEKQIKTLNNNPGISIVGSNIYLVDDYNNIVGERYFPELHKDIRLSFLVKQPISNPTIMLRKKDIEEVGLFNEEFTKGEDLELFLRFLSHGKKMFNLQEKLVYYRTQANSNERRGTVHFRNVYIARKRHSKSIWPFYQRFLSLLIYSLISHSPNVFLDHFLNLEVVKKIKNIKEGKGILQ